jgi:general secretion pathway protein G
MTTRPQRRRGFTLIELMVVVIIIAALATMVIPYVMPATDAAKRNISIGEIAGIHNALKVYRLYNGRYPTTEEGLEVLRKPSGSKVWTEAYLENEPIDPWSRRYHYRHPAQNSKQPYDIWSAGPDGKTPSEDDVTNWGEEWGRR